MKKLVCLLFSILLIVFIAGCDTTNSDTTNSDTEDCDPSFVVVEQQLLKGYYYKIAYHKETKVMYVLGQYNDFTVMLDAEGKPLLWECD